MYKTKVLFLSSNPKGFEEMKDTEIRDIQEGVKLAGNISGLEFIQAYAVRPKDLLQNLNEHNPDILHFSGYGTKDGDL